MNTIENHEPSAWLRGRLEPLFVVGKVKACPHLRSKDWVPGSKCYYALWAPDKIACPDCRIFLALPIGSDEDAQCDRCGKVTTPIYPAQLGYSTGLVVCWGFCRECAELESPDLVPA